MKPPFVHELRVRWNECDPQGVVFNANYVAYFDDAVGALWRRAFGSYGAMVERGLDMVVAELNTRYLAPAQPEEEIRVELTIEHLGTTSMTSRLEVRREAELLTEGRLRHVFVDTATHEKAPIPDWLRKGLEPYLETGGPLQAKP